MHYCIRVWKLTLTMAYYSASIKTASTVRLTPTLCTKHSSLKLYYHSIKIALRQRDYSKHYCIRFWNLTTPKITFTIAYSASMKITG